MDLSLDNGLSYNYHSGSQLARVLTEEWIIRNMFCPRCGYIRLNHFENNKPVADFYCSVCGNQYELKSKNGVIGKKVTDGAYSTMITRITSNSNPDFLFMSYCLEKRTVTDLLIVPKHFFHPDIIEKRNPLSTSARRSAWTGCNILLEKIPIQGKINIITNGVIFNSIDIINRVAYSNNLKLKNISARGWLFDVLRCVNSIPAETFTLSEIYKFEGLLQHKYHENNNIKPKIRQQLQMLRDRGFVEFLGNGKYRKII